MGLRHALLSAGARHVISALWSVDDQAAPRMMAELYRGLSKDESPAQVLWHALAAALDANSSSLLTASQCGAWTCESAGWSP
jgi:CHAT domain-containing protein